MGTQSQPPSYHRAQASSSSTSTSTSTNMGGFISRVIQPFIGKRQARILMLGLDGAGKTTILYKLQLGEIQNTVPTIGFNVETLKYKNISFTMWDVGGQEKIRRLWKHYFIGTQGLIFVVDSNDTERIDVAAEELNYLLSQDELRDSSVLVLCNKQDLPHAVSPSEISRKFGLDRELRRRWHVQACSAPQGHGLWEGFDWLASNLPKA